MGVVLLGENKGNKRVWLEMSDYRLEAVGKGAGPVRGTALRAV